MFSQVKLGKSGHGIYTDQYCGLYYPVKDAKDEHTSVAARR